ncbi:transposase [Streptomyces sp. NPDC001920]
MGERKPYKTDVSDEQWALFEPVIAAWEAAHPSISGHRGRYEMREIVNALLYRAAPAASGRYSRTAFRRPAR